MWRRLTSWDNLLNAYRQASRGKRGHPNVARFEHGLEDHLFVLQGALQDRSYRPGAYHHFLVHDPKCRRISAAPFRDRVVHHALCNLIEPLFEHRFIHSSFASRVGKGTHRALDRCQTLAQHHRYVLQCDIREFFPSIDHAILRQELKRYACDPDIGWLIDKIISSGEGVLNDAYTPVFFPGEEPESSIARPRGLPIGNLTSQFWANVYLNPFDHFIKRELGIGAYLRYVDDILLFAHEKTTLWQALHALEKRLARLRLTIHSRAHPRPTTEGIPFLGFVIYPDHRDLKRRKGVHYRRRLRRLVDRYWRDECDFKIVLDSARGWLNHVGHGQTTALRTAVLWETGFIDAWQAQVSSLGLYRPRHDTTERIHGGRFHDQSGDRA